MRSQYEVDGQPTLDPTLSVQLHASTMDDFPSTSFPLRPVLHNPVLFVLASHRQYYRGGFAWVLLTVVVAQLRLAFASQLTLTLMCTIGICGILTIELTGMDQYVLGRLVSGFQYWLLISNVLVVLLTQVYARHACERTQLTSGEIARLRLDENGSVVALNSLLFFLSSCYSFSLDAFVRTAPRVKTAVLSLLLLNLVFQYARDFWEPIAAHCQVPLAKHPTPTHTMHRGAQQGDSGALEGTRGRHCTRHSGGGLKTDADNLDRREHFVEMRNYGNASGACELSSTHPTVGACFPCRLVSPRLVGHTNELTQIQRHRGCTCRNHVCCSLDDGCGSVVRCSSASSLVRSRLDTDDLLSRAATSGEDHRRLCAEFPVRVSSSR